MKQYQRKIILEDIAVASYRLLTPTKKISIVIKDRIQQKEVAKLLKLHYSKLSYLI